jgi:hypothetical protein
MPRIRQLGHVTPLPTRATGGGVNGTVNLSD